MRKKVEIFIVIILLVGSYLILSFNIQNQGIYIDEVFHHTFGMVYFDSFVKGDLLNPCITGRGECTMLNLECAGEIQWLASGGPVKGFFVGLGDSFFSHEERIYYAGLDLCRPIHKGLGIAGVNIPTQSELAAARFFSPIFGSLTVVITYMTGKFLFSRVLGISAAFMLLFHSLWMLHSRIITSEVYVNFFMMLALCILLYSINSKSTIKVKYLILSAITFGLAINTKLTIIETIPVFIFLICFRSDLELTIRRTIIKERIFSKKTLTLVSVFLVVTFTTVITTFPYYYVGPIEQLKQQYDGMVGYTAVNEPWNPTKNAFIPIGSTFSATIAPLFDTYYKIVDPQNIPLSAKHGHTFSSIPLSTLFLIGVIFIILKIKRKNISSSEAMLIVWYLSTYIFTSLTAESYNQTRYFVPMIFPMIIIMSYGMSVFTRDLPNILRVSFVTIAFLSHAVTYLIFWKMIYFNPQEIWRLPLNINFQRSLEQLPVVVTGLVFVLFMIMIISYRVKEIKS